MLNFDSQPSQGGTRQRGQQQTRSGIPKLQTVNVSTEKRLTTIIEVRNNSDMQRCAVKINYGGTLYIWDLKYSNPNLKALGVLFGKDESQWAGSKFLLALQEDSFTGVSFPTVFEDATPAVPATRKR